MKSIVIFGTFAQRHILSTQHSALLPYQFAKTSTETGGSTTHLVNIFLNSNWQTHLMTKLGNDLASLTCQDELEQKGCFVYAKQEDIPLTSETVIRTRDHEYILSLQDSISAFSADDDLPFAAIAHCDYGLLSERNEKFVDVVLRRAPHVKWIFNHTFPNANLLRSVHGVLLNESEFNVLNKGYTLELMGLMITSIGVRWLIVLMDNGDIMYYTNKADDTFAGLDNYGANEEKRSEFLLMLLEKLQEKEIEEAILDFKSENY
jgi:hypothetical protein